MAQTMAVPMERFPIRDTEQEADALVESLFRITINTTPEPTGEHPTLKALGRVGSHFVRPAPEYLEIRPRN